MTLDAYVHGHIDFGPVHFPVLVGAPAMLAELEVVGFVASAGAPGPPGAEVAIGPTIVVDMATELPGGSDAAIGGTFRVAIVETGEVVDATLSNQEVASTPSQSTWHAAPVPSGGSFATVAAAAHAVLSVMTERVVRFEADWTHVHAAAVSVHGCGVVIPAVSGSGKTSLAIDLGHLGGVLTDELVAIDSSAGLVRAPQRPLSVKASGFARLVARHPDLPAPHTGAPVVHVRLASIGLAHLGAARPHVVVLPHRRPGGCVLTSADPGEVLMALIANSYDLDVDPARAFADLAWLAGTCHGLQVAYNDAAEVAPMLAGWVAENPDPPAHRVVRTDRVDDGVLAAAMGIGEVRWQPTTREVAWVKV